VGVGICIDVDIAVDIAVEIAVAWGILIAAHGHVVVCPGEGVNAHYRILGLLAL
jgi:hypothetical protein